MRTQRQDGSLVDFVHAEIQKYVERPFEDREDFVSELRLLSDDLSAVALSIESQLGVKIDRTRYREVHNVEQYARLLSNELSELR